ncbi:hypothetical protein JG688_00016504 [Phytophthora aleatoria]|uniref:Uncharacterized protein n=1 Tax=Phytophthora aleatoria TaxID=2496075 RepID=A0A8J5MCU0_9STRA|nr:hypothetical protein JG688_00016504 [Phytophthora aleatoria]
MDVDEDVLLAAVVTSESAVVDTLWVASKKEKTNILTLPPLAALNLPPTFYIPSRHVLLRCCSIWPRWAASTRQHIPLAPLELGCYSC